MQLNSNWSSSGSHWQKFRVDPLSNLDVIQHFFKLVGRVVGKEVKVNNEVWSLPVSSTRRFLLYDTEFNNFVFHSFLPKVSTPPVGYLYLLSSPAWLKVKPPSTMIPYSFPMTFSQLMHTNTKRAAADDFTILLCDHHHIQGILFFFPYMFLSPRSSSLALPRAI